MNEDKDSKTEQPTEKKVSQAVEDGSIPYSKEVTNSLSILAVLFVLLFFSHSLVGRLALLFQSTFANSREWPVESLPDLGNVVGFTFWHGFAAIAPLMFCLMVFGILSPLLQNRPNLVLKRIQPKFSNVSPAAGFKRLFGKKTLREFAKSVFKIAGIGALAAVVIYGSSNAIFGLVLVPAEQMLIYLEHLVLKTVAVILIATMLLAIADLLWTRREWITDLMMTKQEVKEEMKQAEGDPMVKMRARSLARDRSRRKMISNVPNATLVVANPTHFAVAIVYDHQHDRAPRVVAKGQERIALRIRAKAEEAGVPVFEDPPLARALFKSARVEQELPPEFYVPVAALIRVIMEADRKGVAA